MDPLERTVAGDTATLARINQQLTELAGLLDSTGRYVAGLQAELDLSNHENRDLHQEREALRGEVSALSGERSSLQAQLEQKINHALELQREAMHLQRMLGNMRDELEQVYLSRSWRVTRPLRFFRRVLLRLKGRVQRTNGHLLGRSDLALSNTQTATGTGIPVAIDVILKGKQVHVLTGLDEEVQQLKRREIGR